MIYLFSDFTYFIAAYFGLEVLRAFAYLVNPFVEYVLPIAKFASSIHAFPLRGATAAMLFHFLRERFCWRLTGHRYSLFAPAFGFPDLFPLA